MWKSIEADAHDLETLYESGLRHHRAPGQARPARARHLRSTRRATRPWRSRSAAARPCRRGQRRRRRALPRRARRSPRRSATRAASSGVLYADNCFTGRRLDPVAEQVFSMVADHAGRAIANARRFEEVAGAARTDALTGLRHHGAFMTDLGREVGRRAGAGARSASR